MSVIFFTAKVLYNISRFSGLAIFQHPVHFPGTCPRFFIDSHNVQFYCIKGKGITEDIFICSSFWSKFFCIWSPDTKKSMLISTIFLSPFSRLQGHSNPNTLIDAKQWVRALISLRLSGSSAFYSHHTTQKNYLHHHQ